ncbi:hypothetical protein OBP_018 [Pseudomonas phage OBP]|uniref:hypothetical protein n=1 Tax=Pseudomonas phage OBP TaxID=1124849 RepID=UPI000240D60F|nr:hypothetical protein OBP_018 [Pseudomonas phage OBP]AEV89455.1 hypothetical protein OBP_018 [Pseudomonas phage OBP]
MCGNCKKEDVKLGNPKKIKTGIIERIDMKLTQGDDGTDLNALCDVIQMLKSDEGTLDAKLPEPYELNTSIKLFDGCYAKLIRGTTIGILSVRLVDDEGVMYGYINYNPGTDNFTVGVVWTKYEKIYSTTVSNNAHTLKYVHRFLTNESERATMAMDAVPYKRKEVTPPSKVHHTFQEVMKQIHDSRLASCDPLTVDYGSKANEWTCVSDGMFLELTSHICGVDECRYEKVFIRQRDNELGAVWFEPSGALSIETKFYKGKFHLVHHTTWEPDYDLIETHIKHFILRTI